MPIWIWLSFLMPFQIRICILPLVIHLLENQKFFFDIYSEQCPDGNKKLCCLIVLVEGTFSWFFKYKVMKKSQNTRNQGYSYYFCLMIEGSEPEPDPDPDLDPDLDPDPYILLGTGSGRPKNIRIRNTERRERIKVKMLLSMWWVRIFLRKIAGSRSEGRPVRILNTGFKC